MKVRETRPRDAPRRQLFTAGQLRALLAGLKVVDLPGERVLRVRDVLLGAPQPSVHDGFAFALAESHPGCIPLTGDAPLRAPAVRSDIEVHGIHWFIDDFRSYKLSAVTKLVSALPLLSEDPAARLPRKEFAASLKRYGDR